MAKAAAVLVHGLFSSDETWDSIRRYLGETSDVGARYEFVPFSYDSPKLTVNPLRRAPDLATVSDSLRETIVRISGSYERIVLVSHSQGGLVVQRYLARMLDDNRGEELCKIRRVVMIACPNNGSELFLVLRRRMPWLVTNRQERELRPINDDVLRAQRTIIDGIEHAATLSASTCPIPLVAYAAEKDNIVRPASARGVFRNALAIPGDHNSVIRPSAPTDRTVQALRHELSVALEEPFPGTKNSQDAGVTYLDEMKTYERFRIRIHPSIETEFVVQGGPLEQIRDVDIIATSANTYLQMSQSFKPSTSGRLRRAAAKRATDGSAAVHDVAAEGLTAWLNKNHGFGHPVDPGTVAPTPSGALEGRGVRRIYHAAVASPVFGTEDYHVTPQAVGDAVHNVFALARQEKNDFDPPLSSICFTLFGAGRVKLDPTASFDRMWQALIRELGEDPAWTIHFVSWRPADITSIRTRLGEFASQPPAQV